MRLSQPLTLVAAAAALTACGVMPSKPVAVPAASVHPATPTAAPTRTVPVENLRFFSARSAWNRRATGRVLPQWQPMLEQADERVGTEEEGFDGDTLSSVTRRVDDRLYINTEAWTDPVVSGGQPTRIECRQIDCGPGSRPMTLDVPSDVDPDPRYDGWYTIVDQAKGVAYDLWRARREKDHSISYQYIRVWNLHGPGEGKPGQPSARGSGLPLFAGLIMAGELRRGEIDHALAISIPGASSDFFVRPASMTDGTGRPDSLPEGARIRLRANVTWQAPRDPKTGKLIPLTQEQKRTADAITAALRTYGAIVVDRSAVPVLYAEKGVASAYLDGNELRGLTLRDFEVVGLGKRYRYPLPKSGAHVGNANQQGAQ